MSCTLSARQANCISTCRNPHAAEQEKSWYRVSVRHALPEDEEVARLSRSSCEEPACVGSRSTAVLADQDASSSRFSAPRASALCAAGSLG